MKRPLRKFLPPLPSLSDSLALLGLATLLAGLVFSRAMVSIGMLVMLGSALLFALPSAWARLRSHPGLLALVSLFFLYLLSGLWSENTAWWLDRVRMKLPFLGLPLAFAGLGRFDRPTYYRFLWGFFWLITACSLYATLGYLTHFSEATLGYREGRVLATPVAHIPFSLMVSCCIVIGWHLYEEKFTLLHPAERWGLLAGTVFLVVFLHVLAVRTGLVAFYAFAVVMVLRWAWRGRRFGLGLLGLLATALGGWLAYALIPSLHYKVGYMLYSLKMLAAGDPITPLLADSYRWATVEAGWHLGWDHPWLGVGIGDLLDATGAYLQAHYPQLTEELYMPQSQFILVFAGMGLLGLLWFAAASITPLRYRSGWKNRLCLGLHTVFLVALLVEQPLENQLGTAVYLTFALMDLRYRAEAPFRHQSSPHAAP